MKILVVENLQNRIQIAPQRNSVVYRARILTFVVAETLPCGSAIVEGIGAKLEVDLKDNWTPDQTFLDLFRDKQAINAMLGEVGGKSVAAAHVTSTAKVQKSIIQDYVSGKRTSGKEGWSPRYARFPMKAYTKRGGIEAIDDAKSPSDMVLSDFSDL